VFRAQFHKMCANCGVDPLASNKGFWAELLGFGDFYYELGVQIVEACLSSRAQNGGLCELRHLMQAVLKRRGGAAAPVSEDDVLRAIERLRVLGGDLTYITCLHSSTFFISAQLAVVVVVVSLQPLNRPRRYLTCAQAKR
jgi:ESCRT-II complex subunit VPS22